MTEVHFTSRALDDLQNIYECSITKWGETTATRYILAFEDAFHLLQENVGLLRFNSKISTRFSVYNVRSHYIICDIIEQKIFVLTIKHTSMNLLERLQDLEPHLDEEIRVLYKRLSNLPKVE